MPCAAPGSKHEATTMMSNSRKRVGISIFEARSMPSRMPFSTMRKARSKTMTSQNMGFTGWEEKLAKKDWK